MPDVSGAGSGGIPYTFAAGGKTYMIVLNGTSGSAPMWGGVLALADQYAHHDLGVVNPAFYRIARSPAYHRAFHDVTIGSNTMSSGLGRVPAPSRGAAPEIQRGDLGSNPARLPRPS